MTPDGAPGTEQEADEFFMEWIKHVASNLIISRQEKLKSGKERRLNVSVVKT